MHAQLPPEPRNRLALVPAKLACPFGQSIRWTTVAKRWGIWTLEKIGQLERIGLPRGWQVNQVEEVPGRGLILDPLGCARAALYWQHGRQDGFTALRLRYQISLCAEAQENQLAWFYAVHDTGIPPEPELWRGSEIKTTDRVDFLLKQEVPRWRNIQFRRACAFLSQHFGEWTHPLSYWS